TGEAGNTVSVGDVVVEIGQLVQGWTIDVAAWLRDTFLGGGGGGLATGGAMASRAIAPINLGEILVDIAGVAWDSDPRKKIDEAWENVVGTTITYGVIISLDVAIKIIQDPIFAAKAALVATLAAVFVGLALSVGLAPALAVFGLPVLAYSIWQAANDYFDRNPEQIERIKVKVGELWTEIQGIPVIGDIASLIAKIVEAGINLTNWLRDLDGTAGKVVDTIAKVGL